NALQEVVEWDATAPDAGTDQPSPRLRRSAEASAEAEVPALRANVRRPQPGTKRREANGTRREAGTERRGFSPGVAQPALAAAADLIARSKRPVILAGHGILMSGATDELRALAERADL